jgi:hypothetical protein
MIQMLIISNGVQNADILNITTGGIAVGNQIEAQFFL